MLPGAAIASPFAAAVFAAVFPPVSVEVTPGVPCPTAEVVERAVARVRGADAAPPGATYRLRVGPASDGIRADLADPSGTAVWSRSFAAAPSACTSVAEAIALIVERQFREIAWTPLATRDAEGSPASPTPPAERTPHGATPVTTVVAARDPSPRRSVATAAAPRLSASVGASAWSRTAAPAITVEVRGRVRGPLQANLGALLPPSHTSADFSRYGDGKVTGQATVTAIPFLLGLGLEHPIARDLFVQAGAEALLTLERGESAGISETAAAWRTVLAGGITLGGAIALSDHFRLDLRLGGYRALLGRSYTVDGLSGTVLEPPAWQALARIGLGWVFLP